MLNEFLDERKQAELSKSIDEACADVVASMRERAIAAEREGRMCARCARLVIVELGQ